MRRTFGLMLAACALSVAPLALTDEASGAGAAVPHTAQVSATNWSVMANTQGPDAADEPSAFSVSCVTSTFCMAVGGGEFAPTAYYAQVWNGSTWSPVALPATGGGSPTLAQVSCVTTSFCVAVGSTDLSGSDTASLIEQWSGTAWSVVAAPAIDGALLSGVACTSTTSCLTIGYTVSMVSQNQAVVEQWNGTSWSQAPPSSVPSVPSGSDLEIFGLSCGTPTSCMAVGGDLVGGGTSGTPWASRWNGTTWTDGVVPPASGGSNGLTGVSCVGSAFCMAVGFSSPPGSNTVENGDAYLWDGTGWTQTPAPADLSSNAIVAGVSCFSAASCTAVGPTVLNSSVDRAEVATWDGAAWASQSVPPVAGADATILVGVDCVTNWSCVAVGAAVTGSTFSPYDVSASIARSGYRLAASDGGVFAYGAGAPFYGSMGGRHLNATIVGMAVLPAGDGYYLVGADGGVYAFGAARFYGSTGSLRLDQPIVGIATTPDGAGYWLVAADGGIFAYGDAQFFGSMGGRPLNRPIVGMAATPNGNGYYEVASDGGIFSFPTVGGPPFEGSAGSLHLNQPVVGMTVTPSGGYYLVASDGGIFNYPGGSAGPPFEGSAGSLHLNQPVVGMAAAGSGYYLAASDGGIFSYPTGAGGPAFEGSLGATKLVAPIVGIAG